MASGLIYLASKDFKVSANQLFPVANPAQLLQGKCIWAAAYTYPRPGALEL